MCGLCCSNQAKKRHQQIQNLVLLNTQKLPVKSKPKNTGKVLPEIKTLNYYNIHYKVTVKKIPKKLL